MSIQEKANRLLEKLQKGKDAENLASDFLNSGPTSVPDGLVIAAVGNRMNDARPCPKVLKLLLERNGNPHAVDPLTQGPVIHSACWHGSIDVVKILLDKKADMEAKEPRMKTPPLNTALAAGNAPVCLELLNRNANVQWTHEDGATALHVACAWIASSHNAQMRIPPVGEEPRAIIAMMLHNGVDPTLTEGMTRSATRATGMTPLQTFRQQIAMSPWREDPQFGAKFFKVSEEIHKILEQGEEAMKYKNQGNKSFSEKRYSEALKSYSDARGVWQAAAVRGHHVAVLCSNEATCHKKLEDWESCLNACREGMTHYSTPKISTRLAESFQEAEKKQALIASGIVQEKPEVPKVPAKPPTKLNPMFSEPAQKELYPAGSEQGRSQNPGPFICHFEDAKEAGFVEGVDGWKDRKTREEQILDRELVENGWMAPDLVDDPKTVQFINPIPPGCG